MLAVLPGERVAPGIPCGRVGKVGPRLGLSAAGQEKTPSQQYQYWRAYMLSAPGHLPALQAYENSGAARDYVAACGAVKEHYTNYPEPQFRSRAGFLLLRCAPLANTLTRSETARLRAKDKLKIVEWECIVNIYTQSLVHLYRRASTQNDAGYIYIYIL